MADPGIEYEQIAFHGGASLHFSWRSPRLSEDLDFLLARDAGDIHAIVERAGEKLAEAFRAEDPRFTIDLKDKTRQNERMIAYELRVAHPDLIGKTTRQGRILARNSGIPRQVPSRAAITHSAW